MSAFDNIANDAPTLAHYVSTERLPPPEHMRMDGGRVSTTPIRIAELFLNAKHKHSTEFARLLRLCLDEACRDALLQLRNETAQIVIDAIQAVSIESVQAHTV
jgi:hypothetical protein